MLDSLAGIIGTIILLAILVATIIVTTRLVIKCWQKGVSIGRRRG